MPPTHHAEPRPGGTLDLSKMHGLGNDFVILDARAGELALTREQCRHLADRRLGVGCDQILVVSEASRDDCAYRYRIINSDGSEAEQCGNGVRCVAAWLHQQGELARRAQLESPAGPVAVEIGPGGWVTADIGVPEFAPAKIPFVASAAAKSYPIEAAGRELEAAVLSLGNPHAVIRVDELERAPVAQIGAALQSHPRFPAGVNVGFVEVLNRERVRLRVYERGVGETPACGSGACAAAVAVRRWGLGEERIAVALREGELLVEWPGGGTAVRMSGPTAFVFCGRIEL